MFSKVWLRLAAVSILVLSAGASQAQEPVVLKLEQYRKSVAARVEVAGKPRLMLFDTGGGHTIISAQLAKDLGCVPFGKLVGFRMMGDRLDTPRCDDVGIDWGGRQLVAKVTGVFDVTGLVAAGAEPIDGLLALKLFDGDVVTLDFAGLTVTIETPESLVRRIHGATPVPVHLARESGGRALAAYLEVPTPRGPLAFELDSGNGGTILVAKDYAEALGLDPASEGPQEGAFKVADGIEAKGIVFTPDMIIDGNLGMPFLKDYLVTLDLANERAWLRRNPTSAPPGMGAAPAVN